MRSNFVKHIALTLWIALLSVTLGYGQDLYNHAKENPFEGYEEDLSSAISDFKTTTGFDVQVITSYQYGESQLIEYVRNWVNQSESKGFLIGLNLSDEGTWEDNLKVAVGRNVTDSDQFTASGIQAVVREVMVPILKEVEITITNDLNEQEKILFGPSLKYVKSIEIGLAEMLRRLPMEQVDVEFPVVQFAQHAQQNYGFDKRGGSVIFGEYEQKQIRGTNVYVPWKSIATGATDKVDVSVEVVGSDISVGDIQYKTASAPVTAQPGPDDATRTLNLNGGFSGSVQELQAFYRHPDEREELLATLNIKAYDQERFNLVIVPVDDNAWPSGYNFNNVVTELNKAYNQAVVQWDVTLNSPVQTDLNFNQRFDDGGTGLLSNYTGDMKTVWRAFKDQYDKDNATYYLFLVRNPASGLKVGYMPKKRQYGFLFLDNIYSEENMVKSIAHELGHGAFRLSHPFSDFGHADRASDNLMDYQDEGLALKKYQWDFIHDPENMSAIFQDEDDAASVRVSNLHESFLNESHASYTLVSPAGTYVNLHERTKNIVFAYGLVSIEYKDIVTGVLRSFTTEDDIRFDARFSGTNFLGYFDTDGNEYEPSNYLIAHQPQSVVMALPCEDAYTIYKIGVSGLNAYSPRSPAPILDESNFSFNPFDGSHQILETRSYEYDLAPGIFGDNQWSIREEYVDMLSGHCGTPQHLLLAKIVQIKTIYPALFDKFSKLVYFDNWSGIEGVNRNNPPSPGASSNGYIEPGIFDEKMRVEVRRQKWQTDKYGFFQDFLEELLPFTYETNTAKANFLAELDTDTKKGVVTAWSQLFSDDELRDDFSVEQRLVAISILLEGGSWEYVENLILRILENTPTYQVNNLLDGLTKDSKVQSDKKIINLLVDNTQDSFAWLGNDNYKKLMEVLTDLSSASSDFTDKLAAIPIDDLAKYTVRYDYRSIYDRMWSTLKYQYSYVAVPVIETDFDLNDDGTIKIDNTLRIGFYHLGDFNSEALASGNMHAFQPIWFMNKSSLGMLEGFGANGGQVIPAIVLKYVDDKASNETVSDVTNLAIDAVGLFSGYTELKQGVTGIRRALVLVDLVGSGLSITTEALEHNPNISPQAKNVLNAMNVLTTALATPGMLGNNTLNKFDDFFRSVNRSDDVLPTVNQANNFLDELVTAGNSTDDLRDLVPHKFKIGWFLKRLKEEANIAESAALEAKVDNAYSAFRKMDDLGIPDWFNDLPADLKSLIGSVDSDLGQFFANKSDGLRRDLVNAWEAVSGAGLKYAQKDPQVLLAYTKLDDNIKPELLRFKDDVDPTKNTIAKFVSEINDEAIDVINQNPELMKGFVGHKVDEFTEVDYQNAGEILDDLDFSNNDIKSTLKNWLDRSSNIQSFKRVTQLGIDLSDNIVKSLRSKGHVFDVLQQKLKGIDLNEYTDIITEVPLNTSGGYMKADVVLIKRNEFEVIQDVIIIENKLSPGTKLTERQIEGFGLIKSSSGRTDMEVRYARGSLKADQIIKVDKAKCVKISDHGTKDETTIGIDDIKLISEFEFE
ncbi:MAG: hypothetical protein AAFX87_00875 [Bacteroidota bacterium]